MGSEEGGESSRQAPENLAMCGDGAKQRILGGVYEKPENDGPLGRHGGLMAPQSLQLRAMILSLISN